jgi:hypothetical protein
MILKQTCSLEYQRAQGAFKDSMIHGILQFTLRIAFRCVLHRCESQEIRCQKLFFISYASLVLVRQLKLKAGMGNKIVESTRVGGIKLLMVHKSGLATRSGASTRLPPNKTNIAQGMRFCTKCLGADAPHHLLQKGDTIMIQPQVHLRLPCYDFYFL